MNMTAAPEWPPLLDIPIFGVRKVARALRTEVEQLRTEIDTVRERTASLGLLTILELQERQAELERSIAEQTERFKREKKEALDAAERTRHEEREARKLIIETEDLALLQEVGIYEYHHPLTDAVTYKAQLDTLQAEIKDMCRRDGGAILATTTWTVNDSAAQGRAMVRDISKLMLRAFNAEADNLVRALKPYKVEAAIERLAKVAETIQRLGKTMNIRVSAPYLQARVKELYLTADFLQKQAEEKELERAEKERLREERKAQQELERERQKLEKERSHFENALAKLISKGDEAATARLREQLADVERAIADVDYRAANIRAGYVYVVSNIGSFGESMVKIGMTRRLEPLDRIRELSDASVPFNFDVHALFFSKDAVSIEGAMHQAFSEQRVNLVNRRREFFRITPADAKAQLAALAGELLEFQDIPDALEYRQSISSSSVSTLVTSAAT
jgi:DNA repair exonuclease SbcCD ATPase subunit